MAGRSRLLRQPDLAGDDPRRPRGHRAGDRRLLDAGATLVGMTISDELAFSLTGENVHYGTPVNRAARIASRADRRRARRWRSARGSSTSRWGPTRGARCACRPATAASSAFAPPTARVDQRCLPLAPRFDTVGWLAREPRPSPARGTCCLPPRPSTIAGPARLLIADAATALLDPERVPRSRLPRRRSPAVWAGQRRPSTSSSTTGCETYLTLQNGEAVALHRAWLTRHGSALGSLIGESVRARPGPHRRRRGAGRGAGGGASPLRCGLCWATTAGCSGPAPPARRRAAASPTTRSTRTPAAA